ncbi:hypothetical protein PVV74_04330 [Roseovarius sp. SK2]|uniref:hypothetical protein n=1 Tax=Roseovarius TaxID=74030 RepID=UPI00237A8606|nr:hypothetical protein [Roseovarius sp. SK2]MDD9724675.1 hypothetical protein [Roseovarius sp. SK2]
MKHEDDPDERFLPWMHRASGVGAVAGFILILFYGESTSFLLRFGEALLVGGIGGAIIASIIFFPVFIGLTAGQHGKNLLSRGAMFTTSAIIGLCSLDYVLAGGQFLLVPVSYVITGGDWSQTYWGCTEAWECVEQGCWCARQS